MNRDRDLPTQPVSEWKPMPAGDLMGTFDPSGSPVDRSTKSDPDGRRSVGVDQFGQCRGDLLADALPAGIGNHPQPAAVEDDAIGRPGDELKFGSTNFDTDEHHGKGRAGRTGGGWALVGRLPMTEGR